MQVLKSKLVGRGPVNRVVHMIKFLVQRIGSDLRESRIDSTLALLMVPVAFLSYLFHECGHWTVGELL